MFESIPGYPDDLNNFITLMDNKYAVKILLPYNPWDDGTSESLYFIKIV